MRNLTMLTADEEIEFIKERVTYYDSDILLTIDVPEPTAQSQKLFFEKMNELIQPDQKFFWMIDLSDVKLKMPDVNTRVVLKNTFDHYRNQIIHCTVNTGANILLKLSAKVLMRNKLDSISFHSDMESALSEMYKRKHSVNNLQG